MLNLTEALRSLAPKAHTDSTRFNKTIIRAIREIRGKKPATNYHKFPQIIFEICVSFGNRSTRSTRSTRICPTTFLPNSVRFNTRRAILWDL